MTEHDAATEQPIEWSQLAANLLAARDLFNERYGSQFAVFKQQVEEATAPFRQFVAALDERWRVWQMEHSTELKLLSDDVAAFLEKLPEWQKNAEANMQLLERSLKALEDSGHQSAGYILSIYEVAELGNLAPEQLGYRLFELTASRRLHPAVD